MKGLSIFLTFLYALIIVLLLLTRCQCTPSGTQEPQDNPTLIDDTTRQEPTPITADDTTHGGTGELKVTLQWEFYGDIDLHVVEPSGEELFFDNTSSSSSDGYLDHDIKQGGPGSFENVFWKNPQPGTYRVRLHYYPNAENDRNESGPCLVTVINRGEAKSYRVTMSQPEQWANIIQFDVQ